MKKITLLSVLLLGLNLTFAQTPLPAGNYYVPNDPGNSSVFYTSLTDAFEAINFNGIAGDITLYINGDINQSTNVGLINPSDHTITIRPDSDVDRTITFSQTTDNAGPSGAICIGVKNSIAWADLVATKNIIIDGFAVGGSTRRLKIATSSTQHGGNGPILLMDECSNIQIKNCIIHHLGATTGSSNYGIYLRVKTDISYGSKKMPSNVLIENNTITATQNTASQGIGIFSGTTTYVAPAEVATGIIIKNNVITARTRGVFIYSVNGITIQGNEFRINQTADAVLSSAIMGNNGQSGDINVLDNKFVELKSANKTAGAYGMRAIIASGGGTWNIHNNFFTGFDKTNSTAGGTMMQAIRCGSTTNIRNNTFYLNALTNKPTYTESPGETTAAYCAINIAAGTPLIMNNIFISNEDAVYNSFIRGTVSGSSDYNIMYLNAGNNYARFNLTYATFASYQAAYPTKELNSKNVNVTFANAASGDLSIAGSSIQDSKLAVPRLSEVLTDIFGTTRAASTYAGAHESTLPFIISSVENNIESFRLKQTYYGIEVELDEPSNIELYTINGTLIDKTRTDGVYSRELGKGMFIIRVNGQAHKFVR